MRSCRLKGSSTTASWLSPGSGTASPELVLFSSIGSTLACTVHASAKAISGYSTSLSYANIGFNVMFRLNSGLTRPPDLQVLAIRCKYLPMHTFAGTSYQCQTRTQINMTKKHRLQYIQCYLVCCSKFAQITNLLANWMEQFGGLVTAGTSAWFSAQSRCVGHVRHSWIHLPT